MKSLRVLFLLILAFNFYAVDLCAEPNEPVEASAYEIQLKNGASLQLAELPADPESLEVFNSLTDAEKKLFLERRKDIISSVVKYMAFPKTLGGIKWIKNQIVKVREVANRAGALINWVGRHFKTEKSGAPAENFLAPAPEPKVAPEKITDLGLQALSEIVQIMDHELWKDAALIARAQKSGWTFYLGGSAGMAIGKAGFYKMGALELDVDYDYVKNEKEINLYYGKQNLLKSIFVFELHVVFGALKRYSVTEMNESTKTEVTALPMILGYRRSSEQMAVGLVSGVSLIDTAATVMIASGYPEAGASIISVAKPLHSFSMYWTELGRKKLWSKTVQFQANQNFRKLRCSALFE